jgi:hypothetical protein
MPESSTPTKHYYSEGTPLKFAKDLKKKKQLKNGDIIEFASPNQAGVKRHSVKLTKRKLTLVRQPTEYDDTYGGKINKKRTCKNKTNKNKTYKNNKFV